jgi:hypothetical protein
MLTPKDESLLKVMVDQLIAMKLTGAKIHNSMFYLKDFVRLALSLDWKCSYPWNLVVDCDGTIKPCLHLDGCETRKISLVNHGITSFDIESAFYADYEKQCDGCFWDCQYEPEIMFSSTDSLNDIKLYYNHK